MLRANLRYFSVNYEIRSLLITSARSGEGKSVTAHRLAEVMASMGDHVVLVEADMHRGSDAGLEAELAGGGLSGFLIGQRLDEVLVELPIGDPDSGRTLSILPSGPLPPNPSELLESERMHELIVQLEERFHLVILDSPPLPVSATRARSSVMRRERSSSWHWARARRRTWRGRQPDDAARRRHARPGGEPRAEVRPCLRQALPRRAKVISGYR